MLKLFIFACALVVASLVANAAAVLGELQPLSL
jgi:hypothetical protein